MQIKTKHNIGDEMWFIAHNQICNMHIFSINVQILEGLPHSESYVFDLAEQFIIPSGCEDKRFLTLNESAVFPTKEELLKSL